MKTNGEFKLGDGLIVVVSSVSVRSSQSHNTDTQNDRYKNLASHDNLLLHKNIVQERKNQAAGWIFVFEAPICSRNLSNGAHSSGGTKDGSLLRIVINASRVLLSR